MKDSERPRKTGSRLELDWVVVQVDVLRRWGLIALFIALAAGAAVVAFYFLHEPVSKRALRALRRATAAQEAARTAGVSAGLQGEFERATQILEEAQTTCAQQEYSSCQVLAEDALTRFQHLSGLSNREFTGSGQVVEVQGKVEVQRANQTTWERAKEKQALYNGDFVKTGSGASASILFSDGTIYRVGAESLLEVHREARTGQAAAPSEVKVKVGQVNVFTAINPSSVLTDQVRADVDRESRVGVEVAQDSGTTVAAYAGRAQVVDTGGERVDLGALQAVRAPASGRLGTRTVVPQRPVLDDPAANSLFNLDTQERISLRWRPVPGSVGYNLQVGRSRTFSPSTMEVPDASLTETWADLRILRAGTYFWRVAAIGENKVRSEWSDARPFKAFASSRVEVLADTTPPALDVQTPTQLGNLIIIQGTTEPGVTVTVNGEAVDVAGDGSFRKAVTLNRVGQNTIVIRATDPAGNKAEVRKQVFVEVD